MGFRNSKIIKVIARRERIIFPKEYMESTQVQLRKQVIRKCRWLLSEINRDPATPTCGCFDRRYWAWKTIDFPEATFQRNLSALAWLMDQPESKTQRTFYSDVIRNGLLYTSSIQHRNGSFDQAYPYEASYGATAFLLPDLLDVYQAIHADCPKHEQIAIKEMLAKSAEFLYKNAELHGTISNHLAGAALGLLKAGQSLKVDNFVEKSEEILSGIINNQSPEGWYVEYGGADPGYQTLCMYYLSQIYQIKPDKALRDSLASSLEFLQYFVHPDGSFGGEYSSRRTEIYYPGGIALLSSEFPLAAAMSEFMLSAITAGHTVTLDDIDMGNTAPLLNSTIKALDHPTARKTVDLDKLNQRPLNKKLPFEKKELFKDFQQAGLCIHSTKKYYSVCGLSNGGVTKLFGKMNSRIALDDCGLLGQINNDIISTQFSDTKFDYQAGKNKIELESDFYKVKSSLPTPFKFLLLRMMNLTILRVGFLNELVKKILVRMLISGSQKVPLSRKRSITFNPSCILIEDKIAKSASVNVKWLRYGGKFSSIHMASARYFSPSHGNKQKTDMLDVDQINKTGMIKSSFEIKF